jgi:hypothetical protein
LKCQICDFKKLTKCKECAESADKLNFPEPLRIVRKFEACT